jgi:phosphohistidine phosphatase
MILYIVRHAWAESRDDPAWTDDGERPLTKEGRRRFTLLVEKLAARGFAPEFIVTSPLVRCRQTAELIAAAVAHKPEIVARDELVPGSNLAGLLRWTVRHAQRYEEVAWVGHAPDVGRLAAAMIGEGPCAVDFAQGAVAAIRFDDRLQPGQGEIRWLVTAKVLGV